MMDDDETVCPACGKWFTTKQGTRAHLTQAATCKWYKKGKLTVKALQYDSILHSKASEIEADTNTLDPASHGHDDLNTQEALTEGEEELQAVARHTRARAQRRQRVSEDENRMDVDDIDQPVDELMNELPDFNGDLFHFVCNTVEPTNNIAEGEAGPGPNTQARRSSRYQQRVLEDDDDTRVVEENLRNGMCIRMADNLHDRWKSLFGTGTPMNVTTDVNYYAPFASELDWKIAEWMVRDQPGHNAFDRLLSIPGVVDKLGLSFHNTRSLHQIVDEIPPRAGQWKSVDIWFDDREEDVHVIRYRNPLEAIKSLWGDPALAKHLVYRPRRIFSDANKENRIYNEMWTGKWWEHRQTKVPENATIAPVIIATDQTNLMQFSGGKSAYPVYLTIGNIPRAIRRKPSMHACVLVGYLSVDKFSRKILSKDEGRARVQRLFHESMRIILEPLKKAGKEGVEMTNGHGEVRRVYPILASYVADYPEQTLVACSKYSTCPKCTCPADRLEGRQIHPSRTQKWTMKVIEEGMMAQKESGKKGSNVFHEYCRERDVAGFVMRPFWEELPLCDIHLSLTPDVLHQLYQGVFKHLVRWCRSLFTEREMDSRLQSLPPGYGVRHFNKGWSVLSQTSGPERKQMAKVLLACLVGKIPEQGIRACRAILDFIYLAQYTTHDQTTLQYMEDALNMWHDNKRFFIDTVQVRQDFNIPKFHSLMHYVQAIKTFGTPDNYNTEMFERLHIDFAKQGYRASNKRDEFPQMVRWLDRKERMQSFRVYLQNLMGQAEKQNKRGEKQIFEGGGITRTLAKFPNAEGQKIATVAKRHKLGDHTLLSEAIKVFVNKLLRNPERGVALGYRVNPVPKIDVYYQFKMHSLNSSDADSPYNKDGEDGDLEGTDSGTDVDVVKAHPGLKQFDTVIVMVKDDAESTGLHGTRVGRVRVIFKIPKEMMGFPMPELWTREPLAYVEWYAPLSSRPYSQSHLMYRIRKLDEIHGAVVPLSHIRQSCMLCPLFDKYTPQQISAFNHVSVLDECKEFVLNNWSSRYAYKTVW